jgi:hypothetical protein
MTWRGEHRAFVVEEYIRIGGSVITTQPSFRIRFELVQLVLHTQWMPFYQSTNCHVIGHLNPEEMFSICELRIVCRFVVGASLG